MTRQLSDIIQEFSKMTDEGQLEKIRQVRDTRAIERPAVAKRRRKKEARKSAGSKDKLKALMATMTPAEKEEFLAGLE